MKTFFGIVFVLVVLAAIGAAGSLGWVLWNENRRLLAEKAGIDCERLRFATGKDAAETELRAALSGNAALQRELQAAQRELQTALDARKTSEAALKRLRDEKAQLEAELSGERRKAAAAAVRAPAGDPSGISSENVESLKDLLEMTDKAPRLAK